MDEYTVAQALRLPSEPSRSELPRRWSSQTHREVMEDSQGTTKESLATMDGGPRVTEDDSGIIDAALASMDEGQAIVVDMVEGLEIMEGGQEITDTITRTPSPMCC